MKRKILKQHNTAGGYVGGPGIQSNTGTSDASNQNSNTPQTPSSPKWLNTFGLIGQYADTLSGFMPEKSEYNGNKGALAGGLDSAYDATSSALMSMPPWGTIVGGAMKLGALAGKGLNALGVGTDGMCVCAGTKIFTNNGKIINIEDLDENDGILGWDSTSGLIKKQNIVNNIFVFLKECLEIQCSLGFSIKCSKDHPILSDLNNKSKYIYVDKKRIGIRNWDFHRADELKPGNFIGVANEIPFWGCLTMKNAYLIGLLIGDGTYTKGNSCILSTADKSTWNYIESNNLGIQKKIGCKEKAKYSKEFRYYKIINGMQLMRELGIVYQCKHDKTLPIDIHKYSKESICELIAGLFDADGSFSCSKTSNSITLYLTNYFLINQIKEQLHKLGIFCSINKRPGKIYKLKTKDSKTRYVNTKESYRISIVGKLSIINFYNNIPIKIDYKKEKLHEIYKKIFLLGLCEHNDISFAKKIKIIKIIDLGILTVYNLETNPNHTYIANGIITHNTTADAILGSSFFNLTPLGLVNALGAKKTNTIEQDKETWSRAGNSYMGALGLNQDAINKSGKKYGWFSRKQYKQANNDINEQGKRLNILGDITDYQSDRMETLANQQDMINASYFNSIRGGYDLSAVRAAKQGGILNDFKAFLLAHKIAYNNLHTKQDKVDLNVKEDEILAFLNGGLMSLIPEGALHKNKHHIEDANPDLKGEITEKGIPVVDKEGEQVCEIERNEIIFSKELTDLIELLRDMYNKAESQKDKDEVARRAGEAISNEVFENTDDRTGLIKDILE